EQLACSVERLLGVAPAILVLGYGRDRRIGGIEVDRYLVGHDDGQSHLSAQRQSGTVLEGSSRVRGAVEADEDSHIAFGKIVGDAICRGGDFVTHDHPFTCRYSGSGGTGISGSRFAPLLPYYFCTLSSTICRKMESRRSGIAMFQAGSRRSEHLERPSALFVRDGVWKGEAHARLGDLVVDAQRREHMRGLIGADRAGRAARGRDTEALEFEEHGLSGGVREAERGMVGCPGLRAAGEEGSRNRGQDR